LLKPTLILESAFAGCRGARVTWPFDYTPYIWPLFAIAIVLSVLGIYGLRHRTVPAALPFGLGALSWAAWAFASALELAATDAGYKFFWFAVQAVLHLPTATLLFVFVLTYAGLEGWLTRRNLVLLFFPSAIILFLALTNPAHHLLWSRIWVDEAVTIERGPGGWLGQLYAILLFPVQIGVLGWLIIRSPLQRWPAALMLGAQLLSRITYLADVLRINPFAPFDAFMLAGTLTIWAYFVALFRFRILSVVPVGRDTAVERMEDGMVMLDAENRIVDLNPAARQVLALSRRDSVGHAARDALMGFPDLLGLLAQQAPTEGTLELDGKGQSKFLQVNISPLVHSRGFNLGRLMLLRDVTAQKKAQAELVEQQRALAALQEREHLGRELHDNLGQVLGYVKLKVHLAREALAQGEITAVEQQLARLETVAQEAHTDVRDYLLGIDTREPTATGFLSLLGDYLERFQRAYQIETDLHVMPEMTGCAFDPTAQVQLVRIVQEALTNTRKHSGARRACVSVSGYDGRARISIEDDGSGFDTRRAADGREPHYGLRFMRERAAEVGGSVEIDSAPDRGTRVTIDLPLRR
jgi:PAS domain S-box-containing protein